MKNLYCRSILYAVCYGITLLFSLPTYLLWLKYTSFALMLFYVARFIHTRTALFKTKHYQLWSVLAECFIGCYIILSLDTFLFHSWLPFPGLFRYAIFDFYIWTAPLFILSGICASLKRINNDNEALR